jgi:hypothetical protein
MEESAGAAASAGFSSTFGLSDFVSFFVVDRGCSVTVCLAGDFFKDDDLDVVVSLTSLTFSVTSFEAFSVFFSEFASGLAVSSVVVGFVSNF